jgi:hypothetical protein
MGEQYYNGCEKYMTRGYAYDFYGSGYLDG